MVNKISLLLPLAAMSLLAGEPLSIQDAIRQAWRDQSGLQAGSAMVERAQAEARALKALALPTLGTSAGLQRTDEPMMVFGTKLNQARISQADFMPDRLNHPDALTAFGMSVNLSQPLYAGGRIQAAGRAGEAMARSEASLQTHRQQQVALGVVQAYFGTQAARQGLTYAEDTLRQAQETERFVQARVDQGLMLRSEALRANAFRAQAEAARAEAQQRLASAQSALALLTGAPLQDPELISAIDTPITGDHTTALRRSDLLAASFQVQAAREGLKASQGSLLPEVGLTASWGTARYTWNGGGTWTNLGIGAKWTIFSAPERRRVEAARASERAAALNLKWQEQQASREAEEAKRAVETAQVRLKAAREAVAASESVRTLRQARHREGLLSLVEVLDAESGLSGARALLLASQLDLRISQAQLALALGQPIEGVQP
ncbi:MAG: outer rane efflux protein [Holophagaceae bacterium]|nr:outer rane efflux protein [Holophagaceae bacterium]